LVGTHAHAVKVNGFKNLINVDVSLGPFTCIAGANGVGKSNLFDAIMFLSALADRPLMDAARCIRDEKNRSTELTSLFFHAGGSLQDEMSFEAEMLISPEGTDDLGQRAKATITFLRYSWFWDTAKAMLSVLSNWSSRGRN
jgi:recombinational DNA repair ATPase RecF